MADEDVLFWEFEPYCIDVQNEALLCRGERVNISVNQFYILLALVKKHGEIVSRIELERAVFGVAASMQPGDSSVRTAICFLRKALRNGSELRFIGNVRGAGYRFTAPVTGRKKENSCPRHGAAAGPPTFGEDHAFA